MGVLDQACTIEIPARTFYQADDDLKKAWNNGISTAWAKNFDGSFDKTKKISLQREVVRMLELLSEKG